MAKYGVESTLGAIHLAPDSSTSIMKFRVELPVDKFKAVKSEEDRMKLALEILTSMENDTIEYQKYINKMRKDTFGPDTPPHNFGYPWKPETEKQKGK